MKFRFTETESIINLLTFCGWLHYIKELELPFESRVPSWATQKPCADWNRLIWCSPPGCRSTFFFRKTLCEYCCMLWESTGPLNFSGLGFWLFFVCLVGWFWGAEGAVGCFLVRERMLTKLNITNFIPGSSWLFFCINSFSSFNFCVSQTFNSQLEQHVSSTS